VGRGGTEEGVVPRWVRKEGWGTSPQKPPTTVQSVGAGQETLPGEVAISLNVRSAVQGGNKGKNWHAE